MMNISRFISKTISRDLNRKIFLETKIKNSSLNVCAISARRNYHHHNDSREHKNFKITSNYKLIIATSLAAGSYLLIQDYLKEAECASNVKNHETLRKDLPTYSAEEVSKHSDEKNGVWVTYGLGVYDITKFIPEHPGSKSNIMLGAGASIDPFWHTYQFHKKQYILNMLEKYRIGNLKIEDRSSVENQGDPYANEPQRNPALISRNQTPFNAETPLSCLVKNFITPVEYFYVRNHLPTPDIDTKDYELEVEIESTGKTKSFTIDDLKKKFKKEKVVAVVMCGGNRRSEMNAVKEVKGLSWSSAACGNAVWEGVRLSDFLKAMGVQSDESSHVILEGYDRDPTYTPYAASIPLSKAMDPRGDVILAYQMNGEPLTRDHGFPLRCIVPGVVGARNVKWLGKIKISKNESDSHWQQNDYKAFSPSTDWDTVDFKTAPAIQHMPVTSAICSPNSDDHEIKIVDDHLVIKGYAYSGGGNKIIRVDITCDQGKNWITAELEQLPDSETVSSGRHYAWTLFTARVPIKKDQKFVEIWSKAVDSNYNCQPESFKNIWNLRGVVSNAYSRVGVNLK